MTRRSNEALKKARETEIQKIKDQKAGLLKKCHQPKFRDILSGQIPNCKVKPFTQRRCPSCSVYRRTVSSAKASKERAARSRMAKNLYELNERQLLRDKEILLQTNSNLSEEIRKVKIAYHNSIQQNITTCKALEEWKQSYNQVQAGNQTLQDTVLQLESYIKKGAVWIALVGLFVYVDIKYRDFSTLEGTFITPTFRVGVMKVPSVSLISPYFMVKIRFCHFLSLFVTFSTIIWIALVGLCVPGVMKIREN